MIFQWGFGICLLALRESLAWLRSMSLLRCSGSVTTMTGLVPGVPQLHITYVHLAIAFIM